MAKKKKKMEKIPGLPEKCIIIKNADKDSGDWMESWNKPKNRSPGHIIHPMSILALGIPGRGKSNMLKQLFLKHQSSGKKFKKLYIITSSLQTKEWDDCEPDDILTELPTIDFFDGKEKTCLIIDDYTWTEASKEDLRRLSHIVCHVRSHMNVSVMLGFQSFFQTPKIARECCNVFMIYKNHSKSEMSQIASRVGLEIDDMKYIFKNICNKPYDHLMIDLTIGTPYRLRKNIYQHIVLNEDSD